MKHHHYWIILEVSILVIILSSCSPAATQPTAGEATQGVPTESPQSRPTHIPSPTPPPIEATPTPYIEERLVEYEYPRTMRKGDSDVLRLTLIHTEEGYQTQTEFEGHTVESELLPIEHITGYQLIAVARLDGPTFNISPADEQPQTLSPGENLTWRWSIAPNTTGRQRISISLSLRWIPVNNQQTSPIEKQIFGKGLEVQVTSFLGMNRPQSLMSGIFGLFIGSSLSLGALFWRIERKSSLEERKPNPGLILEHRSEIEITNQEKRLLRALFNQHARLIIIDKFLSGYSGANTYLVQPVHKGGQIDAPSIVKISSHKSIQREYENYEAFVKDRLPPITARIQHAPVTLPDKKDAAVQYTFIAEPGTPPTSLRESLLQNPDPRLLQKLYETFGPSWWMQREVYTFRLAQEYDLLLPPHYVLEPINWKDGTLCRISEQTQPENIHLKIGDIVPVNMFQDVELRADRQSYTLIGKSNPGQPALRIRWLNAELPKNSLARVIATRDTLLRSYVQSFYLYGLPDPLLRLADLLQEQINGTKSIIHGDLNLENVLVGPGGFVWLIDFTQTRLGHTIFDFTRLGTELIAHVISLQAGSAEAYFEMLLSGNHPLWVTVQNIGHRCLFNDTKTREYDLSMVLACIGALKFSNLSPLAKHCLYLTAAWFSSRLD